MFRQLFNSTSKLRNLLKFSTNGQLSEEKITEILKNNFKGGEVRVQDISGGCGSLFEVYVKSPKFYNLSLVKQHQMINKILKEEVKQMHGIRIFTEAG